VDITDVTSLSPHRTLSCLFAKLTSVLVREIFTMVDVTTFRTEVTFIVNNLAKAVAAEIFTAAEKLSLNRQNPEAEDRLGALVDTMCVEAVEKILEMVEVSDPELRAPPPPPPPPPPCPCSSDGVMRPQTEEGEDGAADPAPTEHTYILVYGSAAPVDSRCVLVSLQSAADADGEDKGCTAEGSGDLTTPHIRDSSPSPPHQADLPDHVYARPSSPPPAAAADEERGVSAARSRKQRRSRRRTDTCVAPPTEAVDVHHRCSQCGMLFPNTERLSDHQKKSHPLCSVCGTRFSGVLNLREHERRDHGLLPYACDFCPRGSTTKLTATCT
ncbi:hypothetical protein INR49_007341, partial [Caranx melampygus]